MPKYYFIGFDFHDNGRLSGIGYLSDELALVGIIKKWDEDGKFLGAKVLKEPMPFQLK